MKKILMLVFLVQCFNHSQPVSELEDKRIYFLEKISYETLLLDSLNNIVENKAKQIELEKNKKHPDEDKIVELMSSSAETLNRIDQQNKRIRQLNQDLRSLEVTLTGKYSSLLDSLNKLQGSRRVEEEIIELTVKKLLVTPGISSITFNPSKIFQYDHNNLKDDNEKAVYSGYLENALKEISTIVAGVDQKRVEINDLIALQRKTKKFLEEAEFGRGVKTKRSIGSASTDSRGTFTETGVIVEEAILAQIREYNFLLNQINPSASSQLKYKLKTKTNENSIDLKTYGELLDELHKSLIEYKFVLSKKLNSVR